MNMQIWPDFAIHFTLSTKIQILSQNDIRKTVQTCYFNNNNHWMEYRKSGAHISENSTHYYLPDRANLGQNHAKTQ